MAEFARVGLRFHLVDGEPAYTGQPQVGLCGAVFIRSQDPVPDDTPACYDCERREIERMRFDADQLLDLANEKVSSLLAAGDMETGGNRG